MTALALGFYALVALGILLLLEMRIRARRRARLAAKLQSSREPKRVRHLEERVGAALGEAQQMFGEVFTSYEVWRHENETTLKLTSAPTWRRMSEFARCQVVRHLWRTLEAVVSGAVVVVDTPAQRWTKDVDAKFRDRGVDLWRTSPFYATGGAARAKAP